MNTWLGNVVTLRSPTGSRAFCCACIVATAWLTWPDSARAQGDFYVQNGSAVNFTLVVKDALQHPLPNLTVRVYEESDVAVGGHNHPVQSPGGALFRLGRFSPRSCNTGYNGQMCQVRMDAGNVGGTLRLLADVVNGPVFYLQQQFHIGAYGGFDIPYRLENFGSSDFVLVGQTATHPDNHYCQPDFCFGVLQLAQNYRAQWGMVLAYNDASLRRGGIFDVKGNFFTPHSEHRTGYNLDVRANGAQNSIPFDNNIRTWFVSRVIALFGQAPLHESAGTGNEHYHIRG